MAILTLDKRVGRILGQVRGIEKMVKEKRSELEILQQVSAVKKAIDGLSKEIIIHYFDLTMPLDKKKEVDVMIKRIIDL